MDDEEARVSRHRTRADGVRCGEFPETEWSLVEGAGQDDRVALTELCRRYHAPVFEFIRKQGLSAPDAEDVTQDFFAKLLRDPDCGTQRFHLSKVRLPAERSPSSGDLDCQRREGQGGRFRTWLRTNAKRHMLDLARARKRTRQREHAYGARTPEQDEHDFDRAWSVAVLRRAFEQLDRWGAENKPHCRVFRTVRDELWSLFGGHSQAAPDDEALAAALGVQVNQLRVTRCRTRQLFGEFLRAEVGPTVALPEMVTEEIETLMRSVSASSFELASTQPVT